MVTSLIFSNESFLLFYSSTLESVLLLLHFQINSQDAVKKHAKGYCVWYGQCTNGSKPLNCLYNGPGKKLTDPQGLKILHSRCPEFRDQPTCCTTKQLEALTTNLQTMEQLTSRCPSCWNNMRRLYCQLTCSPDQSVFMDVTKDELKYGTNNTIQQVDYYVAPEFKQGLFNSCKDVTFPESNEKVLSFLCGTSAAKCTPQKLLTYMGSISNGFAPFTIKYKTKLAKNLSWMNNTILKCNQKFVDPVTNRTAYPCSCQDCAASCPHRPPPPPQPTHRKILGLDVLSFSLLIAYIIFILIFFPISILCSMRKKNKRYTVVSDSTQPNLRYSGGYPPVSSSLAPPVDSSPGVCERLGSKLESVLRYWFTKWGVWCSTHPFYVMGACAVVIGILACGLFYFTVTTDPVELWSAPDSEARKEKENYDTKFNPFYRTEQLIIRPKHNVPAGYHQYPYSNFVPFGPIFHLDLLNQVCMFGVPTFS